MNRVCISCKTRFSTPWRGWYDTIIPEVCSIECFADCVRFNFDEIKNREAIFQPFPHRVIDFRSDYEQRFWQLAVDGGMIVKYEPYAFTLSDKSRYVPDFFLNNRVFVEVKGIWRSEGKVKLLKFIREFEYPTFVVDLKMLSTLSKRREDRP